ncbi:MAG TPA: hypothetical protein VF610_00815, partial [Segetibacter sp.]
MKSTKMIRLLSKTISAFFTLISQRLPPWKEDRFEDVLPPMLSLPVSLPVNYHALLKSFATQFVKVKSIRRR